MTRVAGHRGIGKKFAFKGAMEVPGSPKLDISLQTLDDKLSELSVRNVQDNLSTACNENDGEACETISKLEFRIKELEAALEIKDSAIDKLKTMIASLQGELKHKDAMRMSQIELLAVRNVELEKELCQLRDKPITTS